MTQRKFRAASAGQLPLVSVVMANYCGAAHLPAALHSVLGQTVQDIEVIVSDDASPDNSCEVVQHFARHDPRVRLICSGENCGPAAARNKALEIARGEWVAIVDSDDMIHPERFEILLAWASQLGADAVADDLLFLTANGQSNGATLLGKDAAMPPWRVSTEHFIRSNTDGSSLPPLGYLKPVFRRSKIGGIRYDEDVQIAEDYDFLLRFLLDGGHLFLLPDPYYFYRRHAASISHRLSEKKVLGIIASQDALIAGRKTLPPHIRAMLDSRMKALRRTLAFERLVSSLKGRRLRDAVSHLAANPSLCLQLAGSAFRHLRARRNARLRKPRPRKPVVLHGPDMSAAECAALHTTLGVHGDVEFVSVPPYLAPEARAAKTEPASGFRPHRLGNGMTGDTQIVGHGLAGLYAMAFLPAKSQATVVIHDSGEIERALAYHAASEIRLVVPDQTLGGSSIPVSTQPLANGYLVVTRSGTSAEATATAAPGDRKALVHIRTPTYRRTDALRRCLESMRAQTWENWVCDVFDDDPDGSARTVCEEIGDDRIVYNHNKPQKFASKNIDQCFSAANPRGADYFCVVEDDNYILPEFLERNIEVCTRFSVNLVLRNQYVEFRSGTPEAHLSSFGIFDEMFMERTYEPDEFRLSLIPGIGVSNGALFWSSAARSLLEIGIPCTATLQEYMRTFSIAEKIHVAMTPLAVWAENGEQTTRDLGATPSYLRRELDLKRAIQILQREAWKLAEAGKRDAFLESGLFSYPRHTRARGLVKALITSRVGDLLTAREKIELAGKGWLIRSAGQVSEDFRGFLETRADLSRSGAPHADGCAQQRSTKCGVQGGDKLDHRSAGDLPLNCHPVAIRAWAVSVTP